jgi:hypothetical protein
MAHSLPQAINFKAELIQTAGSKMKQTRRFAGVLFMSGAVALAATLAKAQDVSQRPTPERTIPEHIEPPGGTQQRGMSNPSPDDIKNAKEALKARGLNPGPLDGTWEGKIQQALRDFQQANQLPATGKLDGKTAEKLGIRLGGQKGSINGAGNRSGS